MKSLKFHLVSFLSGAINAVFGSGGGILCVMALKKQKLTQKKAQATALAATVLLSTLSTVYYLYNNYFDISEALVYIPFGIPGALTGSYILNKLPNKVLKKIFAVFIIWAGLRMILK